MALLDFETALGRMVRARESRDPFRHLRLEEREYACLGALASSPGFHFTVGVQRSWCTGRSMNACPMTLSLLPEKVRRELLDQWIECGGGTSSFFEIEAEGLLEFIAQRLTDPSHELTACRFEQATLRANLGAASFEGSGNDEVLSSSRPLKRGRYAGMVFFHGEPEPILDALFSRKPLPPVQREAAAILFSPGAEGLWRPARVAEVDLWERLASPAPCEALKREGYEVASLPAMVRDGAVESVELFSEVHL